MAASGRLRAYCKVLYTAPPAPRVGLHCGGNKGLGNWAVRIIVGQRNLRGTRVPAQWHLRSLVGRGEHS